MIRIDRRIGSAHLQPLLQKMGVPVQVQTLEYGDVAFEGRGPEERPVPVGIEVKTLGDLLASLTTGRLMGHQMPGLLAHYEHVYLVVQGFYKINREGAIETRMGRDWHPLVLGGRVFLWRDLSGLLTTLETRCGVHLRQTSGAHETALTVAGLYHWWTGKAYADHRSHLAFHEIPDSQVSLGTPPLVVRLAKELPGIGYKRAHAIGAVFPTPQVMANASAAQWAQIEGIGSTLAHRLERAWVEGKVE